MSNEALVERIQQARSGVEDRRNNRLRLETRKEDFTTQITTFKQSLADKGIAAGELDRLVDEAKQDLEQKLTALETALNGKPEG